MANCSCCTSELDAFTKIADETRYVACNDCLTVSHIVHDNGQVLARNIDGLPAVADLAESGSVTEGILTAAREAVVELPAFPDVPLEVVRMVHDPITSMDDLARAIGDDASLSLRILRLANSAYISPASEISELNQACAMLGMKTINQMAYAACTVAAYERISKKLPGHVRQLWLHSVFSARCTEEVAIACGVDREAPSFLAGLVHDMGKLVLLDATFNRYTGRLGRLEEDAELLDALLAKLAPLVGAHVVQQWELADPILAATYFIQCPELLDVDEWRPLVYSVALGSKMATALGYDIGVEAVQGDVLEDAAELAQRAKFDRGTFQSVFENVSNSAGEYAGAVDLN